jgi:hypothetical protein
MSKLRDILDDLVTKEHNHAVKGDTTDFVLRDIAAAEQQIKDLMLETAEQAGLLGHDYAAFEDEVNKL